VAGLTEPDGSAPLISVVVTAYNRREYLKRAVDSVLCQTLPRDRYEVVVSKNFQTEFDDAWTSRNVRLVWFGQGGSGSQVADALRYCRGEVVCFLDDDDWWAPRKLEHVVRVWQRNPGCVYYHHGLYFTTTTGRVYGRSRRKTHFNASGVCIAKRILLENIEYLKENPYPIDLFYWVIANLSGGKIILDNHPLSYYRSNTPKTGERQEALAGGQSKSEIFKRMIEDSGNHAFAKCFYRQGQMGAVLQRAYRGEQIRMADLRSYLHGMASNLDLATIEGLLVVLTGMVAPNLIQWLYNKRNNF
jgi:Glycosyltransferases involved in cell wall biogenesis